ncbi:hydroxymethylbilane synthase [Pedobacter westerhofensis]|uniref:Porphobilinogen deaminase n=1 Tax=Pedobacter westerhofensis TaxID=425512 RepID=A0A521F3Q5_9SPHI|nr:hydroxymethylbilane synthase [Pedobacter westerhofensis]SMO90804.1 hydroxymethylbilane synthase [Pedobacter westerhofensis]
MKKLIIGTRGSDLALWQANFTKDKLAEIGVESELKIIKTQGDKILNLRLDKLEGKGFFTKELEEGLLNGTIDIAVHSHKDLPTTHPAGLIIAAVSEREDPSELLLILKDCVDVTQKLSLKTGAQVGTSSNRRKAQLLAMRTDLNIEDLRGNINTRIQKLRDENYDAIMIAKAGVARLELDLSEFHMEVIDPTELVPAPAQGVLAIQIRENDQELFDVLQKINDADVAASIAVERKVLNLFEGGCHMPLGCYCRKEDDQYEIWTSKADSGDDFPDRVFLRVDSLEGLPEKIVAKFDAGRKLPSKVFISREIGEHSYFRRALEKNNIEIEGRSLIRTFPIVNVLDPFYLKHIDWIFFSSRNGVEYFFHLKPALPKHVKFGVVGRGSEDALRKFGHLADFVGETGDITEVAEEFAPMVKGATVLFPRAQDSLLTIQKSLTADTKVVDLPIYETVIEEDIDQTHADILIFTSPSNVEAYFVDNLLEPGQKVIAIGNSTGKKFDEMGVQYTLPYSPDEIGLAEAVFGIDIK